MRPTSVILQDIEKFQPTTALVDVFDDHQRRYSTRCLCVELRELGHQMGRHAIHTALRR